MPPNLERSDNSRVWFSHEIKLGPLLSNESFDQTSRSSSKIIIGWNSMYIFFITHHMWNIYCWNQAWTIWRWAQKLGNKVICHNFHIISIQDHLFCHFRTKNRPQSLLLLISGAFISFGAPNSAQKNHPWSASLGDVDLKNSFTIKKALSPRLKGVWKPT